MSPKPVPAIEIEQLSFAYGRREPQVLAISHWRVERGEHTFISGPSGSGKSTLLNILGGVLLPTAGNVRLLGQALSAMSGHQRDRFRARHMGMVFQQFNLVPYLSVLDNIRLAGYFAGSTGAQLTRRAEGLFDGLGLHRQLLDKPAAELSVGQQQRVAIARGLINHPEILIADEPTSALDAKSRDQFMGLMLKVADANDSTVVFVSHDETLADHFSHHQSLLTLNQATSLGHDKHSARGQAC